MDVPALDDGRLLQEIARARTEALAELYDRYGRLIFSLALRTTGEPTSAEEITQDVFLRAWEHAGHYRADQGTVRTWLAAIARHRAIDHLRRQGVRGEAQTVSWDELEEGPASDQGRGNPQHAAELSTLRSGVRAAVAQLPEEQRDVLALAYFRGYTQTEIATALGVPLGTVKTRIRLAMDKLRTALRDQA